MSLKLIVSKKIMDEVVKCKGPSKETVTGKAAGVVWRVLVVDKLSMRIVSACIKVHELSDEGITLIEDIRKKREPLIGMEAVYFITPSEESIRELISDFESPKLRLYKSAHVFFTAAVPDILFEKLQGQNVVKYMKTCKEINVSFVPYESRIFSLDSSGTFQHNYSPSLRSEWLRNMEPIADQIATLCATLGEYPSIRYRVGWERNLELAQLVEQKLFAYKTDEPSMGVGPEKVKSTLLILDRGFDCISPLLHELTLQAMAYDLLPISNDVYKYEHQDVEKEVLLNENDPLWCKFRNQHIAVVSKKVTADLNKFTELNRNFGDKAKIRDLSQMINDMPHHKKELSDYAALLTLAENCLKDYKDYYALLCGLEQDLAMGTNANDEKIKDHLSHIANTLLDKDFSNLDKVRIIALYVLIENGMSEEKFNRVANHVQIDQHGRKMILNLAHLGINVITDKSQRENFTTPREDRNTEETYQMSRWTPVVKDIIENSIDGKLDLKRFPYLSDHSKGATCSVQPTSARYGHWRDENSQIASRKVPRLIVFIVGGMSYSEMRCAYEVTEANKNWEVIVGSSHILTPEEFLNDLGAISQSI